MNAQVIVDVAAKQTDRVFDYHVPDELQDIEIGLRVVVPFGRRKVQGFVVGLSETSDFNGKLKDLLIVVDEMPPLTPELVNLSDILAKKIFSYRISILQVMLPRVMRANYRKILVPIGSAEDLDIFQKEPLDLNRVTDLNLIKQSKKLLSSGKAKIEYLVENKAKEKKEYFYQPTKAKHQYLSIYENLRSNANSQKKLLMDIIEDFESYPKQSTKILKKLNINNSVLKIAITKGWLTRKKTEIYRDPLKNDALIVDNNKDLILNNEQTAALDKIKFKIKSQESKTFLLEGITGSGKTEIYLHAIQEALNQGRNALMLVPEISLTPQMVKLVRARFGSKVAVLHSGLSAGERYDEWRRIRRGEANVVVGARSAIFAPLENIGIIIIDEEHESSYKQEDNPRYHARQVAIIRSKSNDCPLVLGSATPSLDSRARAQKGVYQLLRLKKRANHKSLPNVKLIDLKDAEFAGIQFDLSLLLIEQIKERIAKNEQVILMLNRRGFASFMLCRNCGFVLKCPNCDISLTLHKDINSMECHYCGHSEPVPNICPNCQNKNIRFLGTGTQKIQEELNELVPNSKILRMDVDTTRRKGSYKKILDDFGNNQANILLGTQMIAKGLDFPNVTLVGVINADTSLQIPEYNSSEKTFDLLTQVAGRAGRAEKDGNVLIQTYNPDHYAIKFAKTQDYENFYQKEMNIRFQGNYPPFFFTTKISISSKNEQLAAKQAFKIKRELMRNLHAPTIILGPTPNSIKRIKNKYYYQILIKYKKEEKLNSLLHKIQDDAQDIKKFGLSVYIDNEPNKLV